jgi:hypothetical protein
LVHGGFWDNNVGFRHGRVVLVGDLDFMGERARIDDLALTLHFAMATLGRHDTDDAGAAAWVARLRRLVDAYDRGLDVPCALRSGLRCRGRWRASHCGRSAAGWSGWTTSRPPATLINEARGTDRS